MEQKVSAEQASKEVTEWLDFKKINQAKRDAQKDSINTLTEAICDGTLVIKEDKTIVFTLKFPIESEISTKALEFKPRLSINTIHAQLKGVNSASADERILAYVAALTEKPKALIQKLDTEDYSIPQSIAIFFL